MAHALRFYALSPPPKLWEFCIQRNLMNKTVLAHGIDDSNTDALAKMPSYDLYYFLPKMFLITFSQIFIPLTIDCFVSSYYKFPNYFSWNHDPMSSRFNVFSVKWPSNIYIFPPLSLFNKVYTKIE